MNLDKIIADPRVAKATINGVTHYFWWNRLAARIAKTEHGYDRDSMRNALLEDTDTLQDSVDVIMREMWICSLIFDNKSFDDFDAQFVPVDMVPLAKAYKDVIRLQVVGDTIDDTPTEEAPSKKGKPKPKK